MSRPQGPHRPFFPFGNPFRMIMPKGSCLSPKLLDLLNSFEESMVGSLEKLKPADREDILTLSWMRIAMEVLCGIHTDIKALITALELPVCDWDDKWIDVYLDSSVKLMDICIAFSSEISRLNQGHLFLQCALHALGSALPNQFVQAQSSLDGWKQHISSKNPRLDKCFLVMENFAQTLDLPKIKNSSKGKVLLRAMYGIKVMTLFVCSVFAAAFSGSAKKLIDIQVPDTFLWAASFSDLQSFINTEIRNRHSNGAPTTLKELEVVDTSIKNLYPIMQDGAPATNPVETEQRQKPVSELQSLADNLSQGLDGLASEVDSFFQVVLTGRDALLFNLGIGGNVSDEVQNGLDVEGQAVR